MKNKKIVITYGTYDMLHEGHLNLLRRAKELGDYLIVGVTSESYDRSRGKLNVSQSTKKRVNAIKKLPYVDEVIIETHKNQKVEDVQKYNVDIFAIGDDWVGKFDYLKKYTEVIYLPRTEGISSTLIRKNSIKPIKLGIVGTGRIAKRFKKEAEHVLNIQINSVMSPNIKSVETFIKDTNIVYGFDNLEDFLKSDIDAVYIASPHEYHYEQSKASLLAGKHVLCEKPATLNINRLKELINIAKSKNLIFLEAIKTAFFPAFNNLVDMVKKGVIGEVKDINATFTKLITDKNSREWQKGYGGATNELATYPLLLACKILGKPKKIYFHDSIENDIDIYNNIVCIHKNKGISTSRVGIGAKSEGCAVISGTKGYIYIPAPWWLTKKFYIRYEDASLEKSFSFDFEGDGLRYEISEFVTLISRKKKKSNHLNYRTMISINSVISKYNNNS